MGEIDPRTRGQADNAPANENATVIQRGKAFRTVRAETAIEGENNGKANQASS
jgi:hypothetical protein